MGADSLIEATKSSGKRSVELAPGDPLGSNGDEKIITFVGYKVIGYDLEQGLAMTLDYLRDGAIKFE